MTSAEDCCSESVEGFDSDWSEGQDGAATMFAFSQVARLATLRGCLACKAGTGETWPSKSCRVYAIFGSRAALAIASEGHTEQTVRSKEHALRL